MGMNFEMHIWLVSILFIIGLTVFMLGLWIMILPANFLKTGQSLSLWVSTEEYFDAIDKPRYQESLIYRYHRIFGGLIVLGAAYTMVILILNANIDAIAGQLPMLVSHYWSVWFYGTLYYILVGANALAVLVGVFVFVRPSMLKGIEKTLNRWIVTERRLKTLDEPHEISLDVMPGGRPRLFGLAVTLGGLYIMLSMGVMLL